MTEASTNLQMPYLAPAQAQKHVTVNEALRRLDAVVQLAVVSASISAQPPSPADGAVYILPSGKSGPVWGPMADGALAYWCDGAWEEITPREGWLAFVKDTNVLVAYEGGAWGRTYATLGTEQTWPTMQTFAAGLQCGASGSQGGRFTLQKPQSSSALAGDVIIDCVNQRLRLYENGGAFRGFRLDLDLAANGADTRLFHAGASATPAVDNINNLGSASLRFANIYAATGTINTSDAREKTPLTPIPAAVKRAVRRVIAEVGVFQWLEAVNNKGADHARLHVGVTAQSVRDAFLAEGEDPTRWGLFCADEAVEEVIVAPARLDETGKMVLPAQLETRPILDDEGAPLIRLGVRADQLMWLALASLVQS